MWDATAAPNGGDWNTAANWVGGVVPTSGQITIAGLNPGGQVAFGSGTASIASISIDAGSLNVTGGTLNVSGGLTVSAGATMAVSGGLFQLFGTTNVAGAIAVSGTGVVNSYSSYDLASTAAPGITVTDNGVFNVYAGTLKTGDSTIELSGNGTLNVGNEPGASPGGPELWANNSLSPPNGGIHASGNSSILLGDGGTLNASSLIKIDGTAGLAQTGGTLNVARDVTIDALASTKAVALDLQAGLLTGAGTLASRNANFGVTLAPSGVTTTLYDVSYLTLEISDHTAFLPGAKAELEVSSFPAGTTVAELIRLGSTNAGTHTVDLSGLEVQMSAVGGFAFDHAFQPWQYFSSYAVSWDAGVTITAGPARLTGFTESIPSTGYGFSGYPYAMKPVFDPTSRYAIYYDVVNVEIHVTYTFTGAVSNAWEDPGNWTMSHTGTGDPLGAGGPPGFYANVVIPAGKNVVISSGYYTINSLNSDSPVVMNGGQLEIIGLPTPVSQSGWTIDPQVSVLGAAFTLNGGLIGNHADLTFGSTFTAPGGHFINDAAGFAVLRLNGAANLAAGVFDYRSGTVAIGSTGSLTSASPITLPYGYTFYAGGDLTVPTLTVAVNTELVIGTANTPAHVTLTGNLVVSDFGIGGKVTLYVAGPAATDASQLSINGSAVLGGLINIGYVGSYAPTPADNAATYVGLTATGGITGDFRTQTIANYLSTQVIANQLVIVFTPNSAASLNIGDGIDWMADFVRTAATYFNLNTIAGSPQFPVAPQALDSLFGLSSGLASYTLAAPGVAGTDAQLARALLAAGYGVDSFTSNGAGLYDFSTTPLLNLSAAPPGMKVVAHLDAATVLTGLSATGPFNAATVGLLAGLAANTSGLTGVMSWTASLTVSLVFGLDNNGNFVIGTDSVITLALAGTGTISGAINLSGQSTAATGTASANLGISLRFSNTAGGFLTPNYIDATGLANLAKPTATGTAAVNLTAAVGAFSIAYGSDYTVTQNAALRTTNVAQAATLTGTITFPSLKTAGGADASLTLVGAYNAGVWTLTQSVSDLRIADLTVISGGFQATLTTTSISGTGSLLVSVPFLANATQDPARVQLAVTFDVAHVIITGTQSMNGLTVRSEGATPNTILQTANTVTVGGVMAGNFGSTLSGNLTFSALGATFAPDAKYSSQITDANADGIGFVLDYDVFGKTFTIAADQITFTVPNILTFSLAAVTLNYDRSNGSTVQTLTTIGTDTEVTLLNLKTTAATGPPVNATITVHSVTLKQDGFELGNATGTIAHVQFGDFLTIDSVLASLTNAAFKQGVAATGSLAFTATAGQLFPGAAGLAVNLGGINASFGFAGANTTWSLAAATFQATVGEAFSFSPANVTLNYDTTNAAAQTLVTLTGVQVDATQIGLLSSATLATLNIRTDGIAFPDFSLTAGTATIGSYLSFTGAALTATNFNFSFGASPGFSGSLAFTFGTIKLFPVAPIFSITPTGFTAGYDFTGVGVDPPGRLKIHFDTFTLTISGVLKLEASDVTITPGNNTLMTIATAFVSTPKIENLDGTLTNLAITRTGFTLGNLDLSTSPGQITRLPLGIAKFTALSFKIRDFGYDTTAGLTGTITLNADALVMFDGDPQFDITATQISGGYVVNSAGVSELTITLGTLVVRLKTDGMTFTGTNLVLTPEASTVLTVGSLAVSVDIGIGTVTGTGGNFEIHSDGSLGALPSFFVSLDTTVAPALLQFPGWLSIQITQLGLSWADFDNHPEDFNLILSGSVTSVQGMGGVAVSGGFDHIVLSLSEIAAGRMPIVDLAGASLTISGPLFGGTVSGTIGLGIMKFDAAGNRISDFDTTTPVASRIFYGGVRVSFTMAGRSGFSLSFGLSEYGPINVYVAANTDILLDAASGLTLASVSAEVDFNTVLPTLTDPGDLRNSVFTPVAALTDAQWLAKMQLAVANQAHAPPSTSFWSTFSQPMLIKGSAVFRSAYSPDTVFRAQIDVLISTDGKFAVSGTYVFANKLELNGVIYGDFSGSTVRLLLLIEYKPQGKTNITIMGSFSMAYTRADGVTVDASHPADSLSFLLTGSVSFTKKGLGPKITGSIELTHTPTEMLLKVNGSLDLPFIGTVAGAAGVFHLDLTDPSAVQFWGALNVQTNFSLLEKVGIKVEGTSFLRIDTTGVDHTETLNVPGQPAPITVTVAADTFSLFTQGLVKFNRGGVEWFSLDGQMGFEISSTSLLATQSSILRIGPSTSPILSLNSSGFMQIDDRGIAAQMTTTLAPNTSSIPGTVLNASFTFVVNTTGQTVTYTVPPSTTYTIPAAPAGVPGGVVGPYALLYGTGTIALVGTVIISATNLRLAVGIGGIDANIVGTMALNVGGTTLFNYNVNGGFHIDGTGIAAALSVNVAVGGNHLSAFGLSSAYGAGFDFRLNTTGQATTLGGIALRAGTYAEFTAALTISVAGFDLGGTFTFAAGPTAVTVSVAAGTGLSNIKAGGNVILSFSFSVGFSIVYASASDHGIVFAAALSLTSNTASLGFSLTGTYKLELNTTASARTINGTTVAAGILHVAVTNATLTISGAVFTGSLDLTATGSSISLQATMTMEFRVAGSRIFQFGIAGAMLLDSAGLTASFGVTQGLAPPTSTDVGLFGVFTFYLNTANSTRTVGGISIAARTARVAGTGGVSILGVTITGSFAVEVNASSVAAGNIGFTVSGAMAFKSGTTTYFTFNVAGALQISLTGVAARFAISLSVGPGSSSRLSFGVAVSYTLEVNTTGAAITFPDSSTLEAGTFVRVKAAGNLTLGGFTMTGNFTVLVTPSGLTLSAAGTMSLTVLSVNLFTFNVSGTLLLANNGVMGLLALSRTGQAPNLGVSFSLSYQLEFNTTSTNQTVPLYDSAGNAQNVVLEAGPYVRINSSGSMTVGPFTLTGFYQFTMGTDRVEITAFATLSLYGVSATASGTFGIYSDGVVLSLQLQLAGGGINYSVFKLTGTFVLKLNTTGRTLLGIAPATYIVGVDGAAITLTGVNLTLRGSLFIGYTDGAAFIQIDNMGLDFFGFGTVSVSGRVDSAGNFSFTGRLTNLELGSRSYAGLAWGVMDVTVSNRGISAAFTAYAFVFGQNVGYVTGTISGSSFGIFTVVDFAVPVINMKIHGFANLTVSAAGVQLSMFGWGSFFGGIFVWAGVTIDSATAYFKVTGNFSISVGNDNLGASLSGSVTVSSNVWENQISGSATAHAGFYLYNPFGHDWWIGGSVTVGFRATLSGRVTLYIDVAGDEYGLSFDLSTIMKAVGSDISGGYAFLDVNGDGVWQPGEARTPVDADGNFTFAVGDESLWIKDSTGSFAFQDLNGNGVWDDQTEGRLALVNGQLPAALTSVTVLPTGDFDPASTLGLLQAYALIGADGLAVINPALGQMVATGGMVVNLTTGTVTPNTAPVVIDSQTTGYTGLVGSGQTVFFDTNGNKVLDPGEVSVAANERGYFTFTPNQAQLANLGILAGFDLNHNGKIDANEGSIVLAGGTDKSNGLPVTNVIRVSAENVGNGLALVAQPLANLQASVVLRGYDAAAVNTRMSLVFGLPVGLDFATVDAQSGNGLTAAVRADVMRVTSQVETYLLNAGSLLVTTGASVAAAQRAALDALVDRVLQNYSRETQSTIAAADMVDFSDAATLTALFNAAAAKLGVSPASATTAAVATVTRELNLRAAAYAATSSDLTRDLARIDALAKGAISTDIGELAAARLTATVFLGRYTGAALDTLLAGVALTPVTAPTMTGVTDLTANLGGAPGALNLHLATATGVASNIVVTATSSDTAFLANSAISIVGSGADRVLVIQPGSTAGQATVTVAATINGLTTVQTFVYTLGAPASPAPVIVTTPPTSAQVDENFAYSIVARPGGAGHSIAITAAGLPSWLTLADQGDGLAVLAGTPTLADLAGAAAATYAIVLTATDDTGAVATQAFNLQLVGSGVSVPAFSSTLANDVIAAGALFTYHVAVTPGAGANSIALTASTLPAWLTFTDHGDGTATLTGTPALANLGSVQIAITATDNQGLANIQQIKLAVVAGIPPVFAPQAAGSIAAGQVFTRIVSVTPQAPATGVAITPVSLPAWLTLTDNGNGTATLSGTPAFNQTGDFSVVLKATDNIGGTSTQSLAVTVTAGLALAAIDNVTLAEDTARSVTLTLGGATGTSTLVVVTAANNALLPASGLVVSGSGATRTLTLTPAANQSGATTVTVTVIDGNLSVSQSFTVTVTAVDDPVAPTGTPLPEYVVRAGAPDLAVDLSAYFRSADGAVTFAASGSDASLAGVTVTGNILAISPNAARSGVDLITVVATSRGGQSGQPYTTTGIIRLTVVPELAVSAPQVVRTDAGNVLRFTVTLLTPSNQTVRVGYATHDGTAAAGLDYAAASGVLEFSPGATQRTIDVALLGGLLLNPANFSVALSGAQNASVGVGTVTASLPVDRGQLAGVHAPALVFSFSFVEFVTGSTGEQEEVVFLRGATETPTVHLGDGAAGGSTVSLAGLQLESGLVEAVSLESLAGLHEISRY